MLQFFPKNEIAISSLCGSVDNWEERLILDTSGVLEDFCDRKKLQSVSWLRDCLNSRKPGRRTCLGQQSGWWRRSRSPRWSRSSWKRRRSRHRRSRESSSTYWRNTDPSQFPTPGTASKYVFFLFSPIIRRQVMSFDMSSEYLLMGCGFFELLIYWESIR